MERYFNGEEFSTEEIAAAVAANVADGSIYPVCMGAPVNLQGIRILMNDIVDFFPAPSARKKAGFDESNNVVDSDYDFQKSKSAVIFKTIADPFLGKYSLIKVCSGVIKADDTLFDVQKGNEEIGRASCRERV